MRSSIRTRQNASDLLKEKKWVIPSIVLVLVFFSYWNGRDTVESHFDTTPIRRPVVKIEQVNHRHNDKEGISKIGNKDESLICNKYVNPTVFNRSPVMEISLLGERNTGTNWVTALLSKCFPGIKTSARLVRWKHWFQDDDSNENERQKTLVIAMFRNPYEWVMAMRKTPHHSPSHLRLKWQNFVTKPWTMTRPESDLVFSNSTGQICHEKFAYKDIISCQRQPPELMSSTGGYSSGKPIYEMRHDGSGKPFANILEMRAAKIHNHLGVQEWPWVSGVHVVRYEDLLEDGTGHFIKNLEKLTGVTASCKAEPPQPKRKKRKLSKEFVKYISEYADWKTERLVGYKKKIE